MAAVVTGKILATVPGLLTVLVVSAAAGYLVTHPPQTVPATTPLAPASAPTSGKDVVAPPPATSPLVPRPSAPTRATPLSAPAPPNAAVPSSAPAAAGSPVRAAVRPGPPEFRVQAGAFKRREYADDLIRQLRAKGYTASIVDGPFIRVWVGPPMSRSAAEQLAGNLQGNGFETTLSPAR